MIDGSHGLGINIVLGFPVFSEIMSGPLLFMTTYNILLTILTFLFAMLTIRAYLKADTVQKCIFKPLAMLCIIGIALLQPGGDPQFYKIAILIGLGLSLIGDIFLIFDKQLFLPGLVVFLLAHCCYVAAFYQLPVMPNAIYSAVPFVLFFAFFMRILWYSLGPLKIPVIVYALTICLMGRFAMNRFLNLETTESALAFAGALVFILSDSLLAYDRFKKAIPKKDIYILGTYFLAQWLIALSI
jgi:uncharacterized membrane protein YhhN